MNSVIFFIFVKHCKVVFLINFILHLQIDKVRPFVAPAFKDQ